MSVDIKRSKRKNGVPMSKRKRTKRPGDIDFNVSQFSTSPTRKESICMNERKVNNKEIEKDDSCHNGRNSGIKILNGRLLILYGVF